MSLQDTIIAILDANPNWSSGRIAQEIGCQAAYVRVAVKRTGRTLVSSDHAVRKEPKTDKRILDERERCAVIATQFGAEHIAEAIRAGAQS